MTILNTTDKNRCNCVLWLRDRLPELPYNLWTLDDKKAIINSSTAVVGAGGMSKDGVWFTRNGKRVFSGHVVLVTSIKDSILTIHEANYQSCTVTERKGTKEQLNLVGFFIPKHLIPNNTKMYNIKSPLDNELKKRWDDFDDEKGDDHKKMAEILQEERHASEYSADTINKLEIEVNDLKKSVTIAENSIIVKIETIEELEDVVRVQTETIKKLEKQIAEGKEPGVLEKAWIFMVETLWAKKPKDK